TLCLIGCLAAGHAHAQVTTGSAASKSANAAITPYTEVLRGPLLDQEDVIQHNARVEVAASNLDLDFRQWSISFNKNSFEWHFLSTRIIFFVVIAIVTSGLVLTWIQFLRDET